MADPRYVRQVLVAELGERGQRAISRATASLARDGLAADVAARYAERAGFAAVSADADAPSAPPFVVEPAARAVVEGALSALAAIRRATR